MQSKTLKEYWMMPVPLDLLCEAGITPFSVIEYSVVNGKLIVGVVNDEDKKYYVCDNYCAKCPIYDEEHCGCLGGYENTRNDVYRDDEADEECDMNCDECRFNGNCPVNDDDDDAPDDGYNENGSSGCEGEICEECEFYCHHCHKCVMDCEESDNE